LRVVFHNVAVLPINVRLFPENNKKIRTYFVKYQLIDRIQETLFISRSGRLKKTEKQILRKQWLDLAKTLKNSFAMQRLHSLLLS